MHAITGASPMLPTLTELNATVTQRASMIAYNDDCHLMLVLSLAAIPLVLLFSKSRAKFFSIHSHLHLHTRSD
jgi:hypothetical protein